MDFDGLNDEQRHVVSERGHCLAIACPGAGKTTAIASKCAYLLSEHERVAAVTFTREAAIELRERIVQAAPPDCKSNLLVGTFHSMALFMSFPQLRKTDSFGQNILSEINTPFREVWKIVKTGERDGFVQSAIRESGLNIDMKEALFIIESVKSRPTHRVDEQTRVLVDTYKKLMDARQVIDFQDMLLTTNRAIREKKLSLLPVDTLLIDEFQDTDQIQYEWIRFHGKAGINLTAVGDDDQSIYAFRRALGYNVMSDMVRDFKAARVLLGRNYRCHAEILNAAEKLIIRNTQRIPKQLTAIKGNGGTVEWKVFQTPQDEAEAVVSQGKHALKENASFAVIARTHRELYNVQKLCILQSIPYRKDESENLLKRLEVKVFGSTLRCLFRPTANDVDTVMGWAGMNLEDRNIIRKLNRKLCQIGFLDKNDLNPVSDKGRACWRSFFSHLKEWQFLLDGEMYPLLITGACEWLLDTMQKFNSAEVLRIAARLYHPKKKTLEKHLEFLKKAESETNFVKTRNQTKESIAALDLITAHAAKGLEFDHVWILGLKAGDFPSDKSPLEEERRLMYVAMTRARDRLWISSTEEKPVSVFPHEAGLKRNIQFIRDEPC